VVIRAILILALAAGCAAGQSPLNQAYEALRAKDYDRAVRLFLEGIERDPANPRIRQDIAYTYLKTGDTEAARAQFGEAVRLNSTDCHTALEYAFLCYESKEKATARRIFDRIRKNGDEASRATAEAAFQNVDRPLAEGIARWQQALAANPNDFSAHQELATLAEQRDELALALEHYTAAWKLRPELRALLVDMGRVAKALGKNEEAVSALLAASRGAEPHAAERARALLAARYPYVYEFRRAIDLDPGNIELRRELAYLYMAMNNKEEAENEFKAIVELAPNDLLSAAQLGFLRLNRKDIAGAMPLLEVVLKGGDEELADRVRSALKLPQTLRKRAEVPRRRVSVEAKVLAERSLEKGYLKDALKYLLIANENDPLDFNLMLKLGWTNNNLKKDQDAVRWFDMARKSPDPAVSGEATRAYKNLTRESGRLRTTAWVFPFYSSRWHDVFSYGQIKTDLRLGKLPFSPYLSTRFAGDTRQTTGEVNPQYLSESSLIFAFGAASESWHGLMAWAEAGTAVSYLGGRKDVGKAIPDYRGGVAFARGFGRLLGAGSRGLFFETNVDGVFVSRFQNDTLLYWQNRLGYTLAPMHALGGFQVQLFWSQNLTADSGGQYWANYKESGPGIRFRWRSLPKTPAFTVNYLRGTYLVNEGNPGASTFTDVRAGFWYAFTH
jgi:tetratricopeptide (TPR) repeat protein